MKVGSIIVAILGAVAALGGVSTSGSAVAQKIDAQQTQVAALKAEIEELNMIARNSKSRIG